MSKAGRRYLLPKAKDNNARVRWARSSGSSTTEFDLDRVRGLEVRLDIEGRTASGSKRSPR